MDTMTGNSSPADRRLPVWVILILFFGSGACALVYETVWVRQLTLAFGISIHAISAVLAAYMFGLSMGALLVGRIAHRIRNPLRVYAWFEIVITAYALLAYFVFRDLLPLIARAGHELLPEGPLAANVPRFLVSFLLMAVPTTLMGGTLPLLGRFLTDRAGMTGVHLGRLYGLNTLGAVLGTGVAGFWALKNLGIFHTTLAAMAANALIAVLALRLARRQLERTPAVEVAVDVSAARTEPVPGARTVLLALFLSGYAALAYEVMWNRTLLLYVHNSTYAFSLILMIFLLGVALGSLIYSRYLSRWNSLRALGIVQLTIGAYVWFSIHLTGSMPAVMAAVVGVVGSGSWFAALANMITVCALVVLPPTVLMGITFPMATSLCTRSREEIGSRIGSLYALNTVGNILGSVVTGFVLIQMTGLRNAFGVAIAANLLGGALLVAYRRGSPARLAAGAFAAAGVMAVFLWNVDRQIFRSFYEAKYSNIVFYREEVTDTVMVIEGNGMRAIRYSDGRGTAGTGSDGINRFYGHLPMLLHADPRSVLSICFGVGNTLSAIAHHEPDRLVCVELSPGVIEAAPYFPSNKDVLSTPNLEMKIEDGRHFLLTSSERFDVIQLEPPEIHTAAVVNLYTKEFYDLVNAHLNEGGICCQWFNVALMPEYEMKMLFRTFLDAFPHASLWTGDNWWDFVLIGSKTPIKRTEKELWDRYRRPLVQPDLARYGYTSPQSLLSRHVLGPEGLKRYVADAPAITDDRTYVDFSVPQSPESGYGFFRAQTHGVPSQISQERIQQKYHLIINSDSPAYLVDSSKTPPKAASDFRRRLNEELKDYRQYARRQAQQHQQGVESADGTEVHSSE